MEVSESSATLLSTSLIYTIFALGNPRQKGHSVMHPVDRDLSSPQPGPAHPQALVPRTHGTFLVPSMSPRHSVAAYPGATPTGITSTYGAKRGTEDGFRLNPIPHPPQAEGLRTSSLMFPKGGSWAATTTASGCPLSRDSFQQAGAEQSTRGGLGVTARVCLTGQPRVCLCLTPSDSSRVQTCRCEGVCECVSVHSHSC